MYAECVFIVYLSICETRRICWQWELLGYKAQASPQSCLSCLLTALRKTRGKSFIRIMILYFLPIYLPCIPLNFYCISPIDSLLNRAYVFRAQTQEIKERAGNQSSGIDFYITQERVIFLDTQVRLQSHTEQRCFQNAGSYSITMFFVIFSRF